MIRAVRDAVVVLLILWSIDVSAAALEDATRWLVVQPGYPGSTEDATGFITIENPPSNVVLHFQPWKAIYPDWSALDRQEKRLMPGEHSEEIGQSPESQQRITSNART